MTDAITNGQNDTIILAIESSCDETSIAVVVNGNKVLSNAIYTQIDIHKAFGGVVPDNIEDLTSLQVS